MSNKLCNPREQVEIQAVTPEGFELFWRAVIENALQPEVGSEVDGTRDYLKGKYF